MVREEKKGRREGERGEERKERVREEKKGRRDGERGEGRKERW